MNTRQPKSKRRTARDLKRRLVPVPPSPGEADAIAPDGMEFTPRQWQVLEFIKAFRAAHPYGPTMRDLSPGIGIVLSGVYHQVETLLECNALEADRVGRKHTIRAGSLRLAPHVAALLEQRERGQ